VSAPSPTNAVPVPGQRPRNVVFKYPLALRGGRQNMLMPVGAEVLHVHAQDERPTLWALVNTTAAPVARIFVVCATGEDVPLGARHLGTVHIGWTVWHVFEASQ
jgi:hypothetical protein